jgi:hypothetical protein
MQPIPIDAMDPVNRAPSAKAPHTDHGFLVELAPGQWRLIEDITDLSRLIIEGQVDRDARVVELFAPPERLADVPSFESLFAVSARVGRDRPVTAEVTTPSLSAPPPVPEARSDSPDELSASDVSWFEQEAPDDLDLLALERRPGRRFAVALVVVAALGAGGYALWRTRMAPVSPDVAPIAAAPAPGPAPKLAQAPAAPAVAAPAPASAPITAPAPAPVAAKASAPAATATPPAPAPIAASPAPAPTRPAARPVAAAEPSPAPHAPGRSYEQLIASAEKLHGRGRSRQAAGLFEQALARRPQSADALTGLGFCALDQGQISQATSFFERATRADKRQHRAWFGLGEAYREQGRLWDARTAFRQSLVTGGARGPDASAAVSQIADLDRRMAAGPTASGRRR